MNKKELAKWRKYNQIAEEVDTSRYITEHGLRLINNLEGHSDVGYKVVNGQGTTYYGITQEGIDGLKELTINYSVKVPDELIGADIKNLSESQAKKATEYIAVLNTMLVNAFTETKNFVNWDSTAKDALLSYFHYNSPYKLRSSLNDDMPGSTLRAIKTNNPCRAAQTLLLKSDGSFYGEYVKENGGLDPYVKRATAAILALKNPDYEFNKEQAKDTENRLRQTGFAAESEKRLNNLADDYDKTTLVAALMGDCETADIINSAKGQDIQEDTKNEQSSQKEAQPKTKSAVGSTIDFKEATSKFLSDFTNGLKNLFTSKQESEDAGRNTDLNMQ